jgi:hypothetical protein
LVNPENDEGVFSWWCYLKVGYQAYSNQQHAIHEPTIKDVCDILNSNVTEWLSDPDKTEK